MKLYIYLISSFIIFSCKNSTNDPKISEQLVGLNIGNIAPELAYKNPEGDIIRLSSLHGKLVLIDFWASWCPPCRQENPNLVNTWIKFKDRKFKNGKGFTIYSVSCDKDFDAWVKAIQDDQLEWEFHVSELKGWEAQATYLYKIESIPSNYLIDSKGIIIAKNLRGDQLAATLNGYIE